MKRVNCEQIQGLLVAYIELEILDEERDKVTDHLSSCHKCRSVYEELMSLMGNIKNIPIPDANQTFFDSLPDKVLEEVRMKRALRGDSSNVVNITHSEDKNQSEKMTAATVDSHAIDSQGRGQSGSSLPTKLSVGLSRRALAIAASLVIVISSVFLMTDQSSFVHNSSQFQASIKTNQNIADMVDMFSPLGASSAKFGFSTQVQSRNAFSIGSLYAESLAYVRGGNLKAGAKHLDSLFQAFKDSADQSQQVPLIQAKLANSISGEGGLVEEILNDLQSSYERYSAKLSKPEIIYLQAGAWTVDVALAALANDKQLIRQGDTLRYLLDKMPRLNVPKGVTVALTEMRDISAKSKISNRDMKNFYRLTQKLRGLLA